MTLARFHCAQCGVETAVIGLHFVFAALLFAISIMYALLTIRAVSRRDDAAALLYLATFLCGIFGSLFVGLSVIPQLG